jgi:hypothetical protein
MERGMSNAVNVEKRVAGTSGRYVGRIDGVDGEAELIFTVRGPELISADHTEAPASMRGTGAAMALVEHMIEDARADGFKIIPFCPYVLAQYRKHPEWGDVMMSADLTSHTRLRHHHASRRRAFAGARFVKVIAARAGSVLGQVFACEGKGRGSW